MTDLQIKCFMEVAHSLSFTKAAKSLFISQSNISRQIASLEEEWGMPLFDRNTKGVKLTRQGAMLVEKLEELMPQWEQTLIQARNSAQKYAGRITIGCQEHIKANGYLARLLFEFHEMRPEIQLVKERCSQQQLVKGLLDDYYDAILIADHDVKMVKNVDKLTLFYSRVGIVIHKKNPFFFKKHVTLADFKDSTFLSYRPMEIAPEDDFLIQICAEFGFTPKIAAHIESFDEFMFRMEMGEGVSLIFEEAEVTSNSNLRFIPIEEDVPHKYLPMQLTRKAKNDSPLLEDLFVFAKKYSNLHVKRDF
jgi:DNA-binding transcriptional LysR family regulator